jgi:dTDP-4-dehydrorhamnose reductase
MRQILVTGSSGLLAPYLINVAKSYGTVITTSRYDGDELCDLSSESAVAELLSRVRPDWVVHAAGMTHIELCEQYPEQADIANHKTTLNISKHLNENSRLVYISTDQVYPNTPGPHRESSIGPVNQYGLSKLLGEEAALKHSKSTIFRTNLFGESMTEGRSSLDDFIVGKLLKKESITLFSDVLFSPLHMTTLSHFVFEVLERKIIGTYNIGSRSGMSKAEFALSVAKHLKLSTESATIGSSDAISGRVLRPHDMRMNVSRIEKEMGISMPELEYEIRKI